MGLLAEATSLELCRMKLLVRNTMLEGEQLVSRSQAKLLTCGLEHFQTVILDFSGVDEIGQAFADEVFRVFLLANPGASVTAVNTSEAVGNMIARANHARHAKRQLS